MKLEQFHLSYSQPKKPPDKGHGAHAVRGPVQADRVAQGGVGQQAARRHQTELHLQHEQPLGTADLISREFSDYDVAG